MADLRPAKRPYSPPSFEVLDAKAAKAKLMARGDPEDGAARQMLTKVRELIPYDKVEMLIVAIVLGCALILAAAYVVIHQ